MINQFITYLEEETDIEQIKRNQINEVIITTSRLSRFSNLSLLESISLALEAKKEGLKVLLEWDILMTDVEMQSVTKVIDGHDISIFDAIRVRDPGAIEYLKTSYPKQKIQILLEYGNHNLKGIKKWETYLGPQLDKIILSIEISKSHLEEYIKELNTDVEVLAIGRIPLFYSPRALISHAFDEAPGVKDLFFKATSEESPHKGFDVVENIHGTIMYNTMDYGPIMEWQELIEMGMTSLRIDFRHILDLKLKKDLFGLTNKISNESSIDEKLKIINELKAIYPRRLIKGFYKINKSDVLFKKLKNSRTKRYDEHYLGEVVEVNKGIHIGIHLKSGIIKLEDTLRLLTPDGKEKKLIVKNMTNSRLENILAVKSGELAFFKHLGGISVKTQVYLEDRM